MTCTTLNQLAVAPNLDACQKMAIETSNRMILQFLPYDQEWQARCGLYAGRHADLNEALLEMLRMRAHFNANPAIVEKTE